MDKMVKNVWRHIDKTGKGSWYLGVDLDYTKTGAMTTLMISYTTKIINEFTEEITGITVILASGALETTNYSKYF